MKVFKFNPKTIAVFLIVFFGFLLRFIDIAGFPIGFNADEASFGYDAYSILKTGRDQWGNFLPVVLKSFGDYKSPLYSYLAIPSVAIFGLSKFAVRLPNAVLGALSIFSVYLLSKKLFQRLKINTPWIEILPAFLLAVNPWQIMLSRAAVESNLMTFFIPLGIYFFLEGLEKNKSLILSAIAFGLSLFTYHSAKFLTPLIVLGLILIFYRQLKNLERKKIFLPLGVFLIFFLGLLYTFKIGGGARINERSIFSGALEQGFEERLKAQSSGQNPAIAKLLHNKYQVIVGRFATNYLQYFSYKFFITRGAGEGYYGMIPGIGTFYIFDVILLFGSLYFLIKKETRNFILPIFAWLLIAPIPAALATGVGYAGSRAEGMIPVIQIIEGIGFWGIISVLKKFGKNFAAVFIFLILLSGAFEVRNFLIKYFKFPGEETARSMLYGSLEVSYWLRDNKGTKNILVTRSLGEPQIFIAFANSWDPEDFQKQTKLWNFDKSGNFWVDQLEEWSLGDYKFKSIDWEKDLKLKNVLLVARPDEIKPTLSAVKTFNYPDGKVVINVIDPNQKLYAKAY